MTDLEAAAVVAQLALAHPGKALAPQTARLYFEALAPFEAAIGLQAAIACINSIKFFPSVAELVKACREIAPPVVKGQTDADRHSVVRSWRAGGATYIHGRGLVYPGDWQDDFRSLRPDALPMPTEVVAQSALPPPRETVAVAALPAPPPSPTHPEGVRRMLQAKRAERQAAAEAPPTASEGA